MAYSLTAEHVSFAPESLRPANLHSELLMLPANHLISVLPAEAGNLLQY